MLERLYPLLLGFGFAILTNLAVQQTTFVVSTLSITNLLLAVVSLSGISVGFLATAMSILFSLRSNSALNSLKEAGTFNLLINHLVDAINWALLLAVLSMIGLVIDFSGNTEILKGIVVLWSFFFFVAGISYHRVIRFFVRILLDE